MISFSKRSLCRVGSLLLTLLLLVSFASSASGQESTASLTLLFTTDIHSNDVPHLAMMDGQGIRCGGFARLKTEVDRYYQKDRTLLLDSGDFSMGTLYQNYCQSDALELTLMDAIGYDAVALGNHDFELGEDGLREELSVFRAKGGSMALLCSNLTDASGKTTSEMENNPLAAQGVLNYQVFERSGLRVGVFSLMGQDAISYTPVTTLRFADPIASAKALVKQLREVEQVDLVVALSHAGTMPDGSFHEDADIAKAVGGIDVILSGHEHVPLPQIQWEGDTMIVCAGTALNALGKLTLTLEGQRWDGSYELLTLDDSVPEDAEIAAILADYTQRIQMDYLAPLHVTEDVMADFAVSPFDFEDGDHMCLTFRNHPFGALIADGYFNGLEKAGVTDVDAVVVPVGFVRGGLYTGKLRMMDVYNALGYGVSPLDGSSGAPICTFWLNGQELYDVCETSVSLSGMMNTAQMLLGGLRFQYSHSRLPLDKVYQVEILNRQTGAYEAVERSAAQLYKVAVSWTAMQNLSLLSSKSFGMLSVTPKDANGAPYLSEELSNTVVMQPNGAELKEWYALYDYIRSMPMDEAGLHVIDARYGEEPAYMAEGGTGIGLFFTNPSKAFYVLLAVCAGVLILLGLLILAVVKLAHRSASRMGKHRRAIHHAQKSEGRMDK
ncbi:MAG: metallophosphatase [Eubacteriales bacterium]|nr:metallophosphatase [Eubacteriales bacterium]